jgi:iron complex outermembrane receptor protein
MRSALGRAAAIATFLIFLVFPGLAYGQGAPEDLGDLDLEQLAQVRVTSVARRPEALSQAPAAIFVITRDEIRRSAAKSLPEALRLAPGLQVARVGSREWAISSRGFNERSSNKLLVLVDGRAVYTPLFAGVFWDVQDPPLIDIERIEVILGPGAALWGSNAVNGVINVITRSALESRGGTVKVFTGSEERIGGTVRYGMSVAPGVALRAYGRYLNLSPAELANGDDASDDWRLGQAGFRLDAERGTRDRFTLDAAGYSGSGGEPLQLAVPAAPFTARFNDDVDVKGGHLLGRWSRQLGSSSDFALQAFFDHTVRTEPNFIGRARVDLLDVDFQHRFQAGKLHDLVWGAGYRRISDDISGAFVISFLPRARTTHLFTGFVQDEIAVTPTQWRLTLGTKFEHNTFSGLEVQPNVRLRWMPTARHTLWGAVSRAVRIPSRVDTDLFENASIRPGSPPTLIRAVGSEDFNAERLIAYEVGYRATPAPQISLDVALFYNDYDRLRTLNPLPPFTEGGFVVVPLTFGNDAEGRTYGGTVSGTWRPGALLRVQASYTYLRMFLETRAGTFAATSDTRPDLNPRHEASLRSAFNLPSNIEVDGALRYVSEIFNVSDYLQADVRLGWSVRSNLAISIDAKDLFSPRHLEFASPSFLPEVRHIPRRGSLQVRWNF